MRDFYPVIVSGFLVLCELNSGAPGISNRFERVLTTPDQTTLPDDAAWAQLSADEDVINGIDDVTRVANCYADLLRLRDSGSSPIVITHKIKQLYQEEAKVAAQIEENTRQRLSLLGHGTNIIAEAQRLVQLHEGLKR